VFSGRTCVHGRHVSITYTAALNDNLTYPDPYPSPNAIANPDSNNNTQKRTNHPKHALHISVCKDTAVHNWRAHEGTEYVPQLWNWENHS